MDRVVKVGIIGCGVIANLTHGPEYTRLGKDKVEIVAACDIDPVALNAFCERFNIPKKYHTIAEMLGDDEIEAVDVCLHNNMHAPTAIEAMRRGKDVYSEKPMAGSYHDALAMLEASKKYGRKLHVQLRRLFIPETFVAKQIIDAGELGHIYHMRSTGFRRRGRPYVDGYGKKEFVMSEISGGGALMDMGVYHISQLLYLTGNKKPTAALGHTYQEIEMDEKRRQISGYDVEELITGMVDFGDDLSMDLIESWAINIDGFEGSSINGSKGGIRLEPFGWYFTHHDVVFNTTMDMNDFNFRSETVHEENQYYLSSQGHWVAALSGKVDLVPTAEIALNTQLIQEAMYMSAKLKRQVTIDEVIENSKSNVTEVVGLYE